MKKIDKVVFQAFIGPFILTLLVVIFILLTQHMLKYFDDLVGKDLGMDVLFQLMFYFAIFVTPFAFPLAVLISSLMSFGNLGEHSELTALKSSGISLPRIMRSIFIFVIFLTGLAFISNNYFVSKAALEAYSLMWDIKRKKPSLDLPEGEFYSGIENYRIRVNKKFKGSDALQDLIIYDHSDRTGNQEVTIADSGRMSTINNDRYLKLELFNGHSYMEGRANNEGISQRGRNTKESFSRVAFDKSEIIFDLSSFDMDRTDTKLFSSHRLTRNISQIVSDIDSMDRKERARKFELFNSRYTFFDYFFRYDSIPEPEYVTEHRMYLDSLAEVRLAQKQRRDSVEQADLERERENENENENESENERKGEIQDGEFPSEEEANAAIFRKEKEALAKKRKQTGAKPKGNSPRLNKTFYKDSAQVITNRDSLLRADSLIIEQTLDSLEAFTQGYIELGLTESKIYNRIIQKVRMGKNRINTDDMYLQSLALDKRIFEIQYHKIIANAVACMMMFLIGAPLGSIIKKGGLGVPVLISIFFFIVYYVLMIMGEKWAKSGVLEPWVGIWQANLILLPLGLFFLSQARKDVRLFESDFYAVIASKIGKWLKLKKKKRTAADDVLVDENSAESLKNNE